MSGKIGKLLATFAWGNSNGDLFFLSDDLLYCLNIYSNYEVYNLNIN